MGSATTFLQNAGVDLYALIKVLSILIFGTLLLCTFCRFIFGKHSVLNVAISSTIGIIFIYSFALILCIIIPAFSALSSSLPLISIQDNTVTFFSIRSAHYTLICSETLSALLLAFLVNLVDEHLPKGTTFFSWLIFRFLTVVIGTILHIFTVWVLKKILPIDILRYAPTILLGLLILMLLTGALKLIGSALLTVFNPIIGALYSFFFANFIGKQLAKGMLTTTLIVVLLWFLPLVGIQSISLATAALIAHLPTLLLLALLWYVIKRFF